MGASFNSSFKNLRKIAEDNIEGSLLELFAADFRGEESDLQGVGEVETLLQSLNAELAEAVKTDMLA
jgi:hypothetical protein